MTNGYEAIKKMVQTASNDVLKDMYLALDLNEESSTEETLVFTAIVGEMENRGMVEFDDEAFEYRLVA